VALILSKEAGQVLLHRVLLLCVFFTRGVGEVLCDRLGSSQQNAVGLEEKNHNDIIITWSQSKSNFLAASALIVCFSDAFQFIKFCHLVNLVFYEKDVLIVCILPVKSMMDGTWSVMPG